MLRSDHTVGYRVGDVKLITNDLDPKCSIADGGAAFRDRRVMFAKLPYGSTPCRGPLHVDSNDIATQKAGLQHRVARVTPFSQGIDRHFLKKFKKFVVRFCQEELEPLNVQPDFWDWINEAPYPLVRKEELITQYIECCGDFPPSKKNQKIASFIKTESYPEFKHARWINSRHDAFKAWSGPWFKAIEKRVFSIEHFIKHTPVPERAAKVNSIKRDGAQYVATDYSSFEAHFHPELMDACEGVLVRHMLSRFPDVADKICSVIFGQNHGKTRRKVSFKLRGRRMSGDMCTSLGNGFTNLMIWSFLCELHNAEWAGYVEGDDGIFAVYSGGVPEPSEYAKLGFTIKIERGNDPNVMSFCGIIAADGQNVRSPGEFLSTFGWTSSCLNGKPSTMASLLRAKALSAAYETPHCPIIRAIADRALFLTRNSVPRFVSDGYHALPELNAPKFSPTPLTREAFSELYGVSVSQQILAEKRILRGDDLAFLDDLLSPNRDNILFASRFIIRSHG